MDILKHPACTKLLGAPADMPEPDCAALPVIEQQDEWGIWSVSLWKPTAEELAELNNGGCISLHIRAQNDAHPVVGVGVQPHEFAKDASPT